MRFKFIITLFFLPLTLLARPGYWEPWGKDADLKVQATVEQPAPPNLSLAARLAERVILFHQNVLTQADGPRSNFRPTSSRYMLLAIRRHGFLRGFMMGCDRLLRENESPWVYRTIEIEGNLYKYDPVPIR
jgi:putative component of membrane protein insertase Oxa1/YidC/SpoIIIJ protein YidD